MQMLTLKKNIGSFRNTAEMKRHVNRSCFYAGLKSQAGMSSFHPSYERTLNLKNVFDHVHTLVWFLDKQLCILNLYNRYIKYNKC